LIILNSNHGFSTLYDKLTNYVYVTITELTLEKDILVLLVIDLNGRLIKKVITKDIINSEASVKVKAIWNGHLFLASGFGKQTFVVDARELKLKQTLEIGSNFAIDSSGNFFSCSLDRVTTCSLIKIN